MDSLSKQFLIACDQFVVVRHPLLDDLAATLGVLPKELFYTWVERRCRSSGVLLSGVWKFFFHGYTCDLRHGSDGRFARIDFGPKGVTDTFTAWGVTQFVMTAKPPWPEFPDLRNHLAEMPPPYDENAGSIERANKLIDQLEHEGYVSVSSADLITFAQEHTSMNTGVAVLRLPDDTPDRTWFDVSVAERKVLTDKARLFLADLNRG